MTGPFCSLKLDVVPGSFPVKRKKVVKPIDQLRMGEGAHPSSLLVLLISALNCVPLDQMKVSAEHKVKF